MISLDDMSSLARALVAADEVVKAKEQELTDAKETARVLREETRPNAMMELELKRLDLESGQKITVKQDVYASIPAASKDDAFKWLTKNGFGGLIKVDLITPFGKSEQKRAITLADQLIKKGYDTNMNENIHWQTLRAFLNEQIAAGNKKLPLDLFGARPVWIAKVK